ncbi:MAG: hypothetical protein KY454_02360 [Actinobacteria bacterium]|nr:hypothetical protein [Actinomycetota bacterium]MBW3649981.1 hypothetical protein [Actinomycetota bacterium]
MTALLTVLSVLAAWGLIGVLGVGFFLVAKSLQSIRHWFEKTTVALRTVEHQTKDLNVRGAVLTVSLREAMEALDAASARRADGRRG